MAKMGLTMKDDPVRVVDPAARQWGESVDGFALSIEPVFLREDRSVVSNLSVVIRNVSSEAKSLTIPGWLHFFHVDVGAPLSAFGRELLKPERRKPALDVPLEPGALVEAQIPIGSIFETQRGTRYTARVSCELPGGATLRSNTSEFTA